MESPELEDEGKAAQADGTNGEVYMCSTVEDYKRLLGQTLESLGYPLHHGERDDVEEFTTSGDDTPTKFMVRSLVESFSALLRREVVSDETETKLKQENSHLTKQVSILEESIRYLDTSTEEEIETERIRNKTALDKLRKDYDRDVEAYQTKLRHLEESNLILRQESARLRNQNAGLSAEKEALSLDLSDASQKLSFLYKENGRLKHAVRRASNMAAAKENNANDHAFLENHAAKNYEKGRNEAANLDAARICELEDQLRWTKKEHSDLRRDYDELQCQMMNVKLKIGQNLVQDNTGSLQEELDNIPDAIIRKSLKEQQEINNQLKKYINDILTNIMEKNPELLEVRK